MPNVTNNETVLMDVSEAKANLVAIQKLSDETILKRVSLESDCKRLELEVKEAEKRLNDFELNLQEKRKISQKIDEDIASNSITLGKLQTEAIELRKEIESERAKIQQETQEFISLKNEVKVAESKLVASQIENNKQAEVLAEKARRIKEFANAL